jgi:cysteine desulfurase
MDSCDYLFFDLAATTPVYPEAAQALIRYTTEEFANPSSGHILGRRAFEPIESARRFFASEFGVSPKQVIFTGSGSESDNLALYGVALAQLEHKMPESRPRRVLVSATEHAAVRKTALSLSSLGFEVVLVPVDRRGQIDPDAFLKLVTPDTVLISVQRVNNITGALHDVEKLAQLAKAIAPQAVFHTDAVQAFGKVDVPRAPSSIDLVSISGHKVHAPKGVGALVVLNGALLKAGLRPQIWGGDQEGGIRSGTQNPGLIASFHRAAELTLAKRELFVGHTRVLSRTLTERLSQDKRIKINSEPGSADFAPHLVHLCAPGFMNGLIAQSLETKGVIVSTGSACSSQKREPDAVLAALGLNEQEQMGAIRISLGLCHSEACVERLIAAFIETLNELEKMFGPVKAFR